MYNVTIINVHEKKFYGISCKYECENVTPLAWQQYMYVHLYSIHVQLCFGLLVFNLQNVLELYVHVHVYINYM